MTDPSTPAPPIGRLAALGLAVAPVAAAAVIGNLATMPNLAPWYAGLAKPDFNPPNGLFGPVWAMLYLLMTVSFWRVLRLPVTSERRTAIRLFLAQIVLNGAWSVAFFAGHSPLAGLVVMAPLWAAIAATIRFFTDLDRLAARLLTPYILWVSFAALLNIEIWRLN